MLSKSIHLWAACALTALLGACRSVPKHEPRPSLSATSSVPAAAPSQEPALAILAPPTSAQTPPPPTPVSPPVARRILVVGDSLSDTNVGGGGYLRAIGTGCPSYIIENRARGGFMVNQMRRRFGAEYPTPAALAPFTDLIVFGGVNDLYSDLSAGRSVEKISADLSTLYQRARVANLRVIALTVAPWGGFTRYYNPTRAAATQRLNAWIAEQHAAGLVDVVIDANRLLSCGDPERLCPDYTRTKDDGLHFGPKGHEALGAALLEHAFPECGKSAR